MKTPSALRISLREILLLFIVVAIGLAWWLDRSRYGRLKAFEPVAKLMETPRPPERHAPNDVQGQVLLHGHLWQFRGERID